MTSPLRFKLIGGHPALDFFNTVALRLAEKPEERIGDFFDLVRWATQAKLIDARMRSALETRARRSPAETNAVLEAALELREIGYRLVEARLLGQDPVHADLKRLHELHERFPDRVEWRDGRYTWTIGGRAGDPEGLLHLLTKAVTGFLTSSEAGQVARCHDDRGCGWLFVNRSRAKPRRWCSMAECGNRAKAKRYYRRTPGG